MALYQTLAEAAHTLFFSPIGGKRRLSGWKELAKKQLFDWLLRITYVPICRKYLPMSHRQKVLSQNMFDLRVQLTSYWDRQVKVTSSRWVQVLVCVTGQNVDDVDGALI